MRIRELYDSKIAKGGLAAAILGALFSGVRYGIVALDWLGRKDEAQSLFHMFPKLLASPWIGPIVFAGGAILLVIDFQGRKKATVGARLKCPSELPKKAGAEIDAEPTLISLMDTSFPNFTKLWGKPVFQFKDGTSLQVTSALYFDLFTSGAKFLGFHVPSSDHTLEICALLAVHAIELGDSLSNGGLSIICKVPGENPQTVHDLRYSGKVYLYHDDVFTHKQMAEVEDIFKVQKLNVVLRGPDFLTEAWLRWKQLKRLS